MAYLVDATEPLELTPQPSDATMLGGVTGIWDVLLLELLCSKNYCPEQSPGLIPKSKFSPVRVSSETDAYDIMSLSDRRLLLYTFHYKLPVLTSPPCSTSTATRLCSIK